MTWTKEAVFYPGMDRKLRVEYPGAIYHVMNRRDRSEPDRRRMAKIGLNRTPGAPSRLTQPIPPSDGLKANYVKAWADAKRRPR